MGSIFRLPKPMLLYHTTLLTPERSLWAKQQLPRGNCQAEITVISAAQVWGREGHQRKAHCQKQQEFVSQTEKVCLDSQPDSTSRAVGVLLRPEHSYEMHLNIRGREENRMCSDLSWWPGDHQSKDTEQEELGPPVWVSIGPCLDVVPTGQFMSCLSRSFFEYKNKCTKGHCLVM